MRLFLDPDDALDATQEVLIKVITHLHSFNGQSQFKTWLYRIVFNHFLNAPSRKMENLFSNINGDISDFTNEEEVFTHSEIEEVRILCSTAMLMCLNREQRLLYIIGEVFGADHIIGAELFETSPANYRVKLHRAKTDLLMFVSGRCGIINPKNPCRCPKKTKIMIDQKIIDKDNLRFNTMFTNKIAEVIEFKREIISDKIQLELKVLFRDSPFQIKNEIDKIVSDIVK